MWDNLSIICLIIAASIPGASAEEEQAISDSGAIALAVVVGLIAIILTLAVGCYCFRKYTLEAKAARRKRLEIKTLLLENQAEPDTSMHQSGTTYINGGIPSDKIKTFGEWRKSQRSSNVYTTTTTKTAYTVPTSPGNYRIRRGSSSPPQSPRSPTYERGRTQQRRFVYEMPTGSMAVRRTVVRPQVRSKSAPAYGRTYGYTSRAYGNTGRTYGYTGRSYGYDVVNPRYQQVGYTRNHYLSVKKPFGKKYIMPPTLVYKERPRFVQKNISVPEFHAPPPPPPQPIQHVQVPSQKKVLSSNVYHVKYEPGANQLLTTGESSHRHVSSTDYNGYSTVLDQPYRESRVSNSTYGRTYQAEPYPIRTASYTSKTMAGDYDLVNEKNNVYTISTSGAEHQSFWTNGDEVNTAAVTYTNGIDTSEEFRQSISTSEVRASVKAPDDGEQYTIVDYVEPGPEPGSSGDTTAAPMSTSTPRFPEEQPTSPSTHLKDLDDALGGDARDSSNSSSSSSSRRSSGSTGN